MRLKIAAFSHAYTPLAYVVTRILYTRTCTQELFDRIVENGAYSERDASIHAQKIALALQSMHRQGIVHRDLKPENLVLADKSANSEIKISDFGLSKILKSDQQTMQTVCGTRYVRIILNLVVDILVA
jgi:serine/threonine protein kinase